MTIEQGDVLSVEGFASPMLVVSKNFFNLSEEAFVCPVMEKTYPDPLHIPVKMSLTHGIVLCEQVKMLDFRIRGFKKIDRLKTNDTINITDAIQSIFDYI